MNNSPEEFGVALSVMAGPALAEILGSAST